MTPKIGHRDDERGHIVRRCVRGQVCHQAIGRRQAIESVQEAERFDLAETIQNFCELQGIGLLGLLFTGSELLEVSQDLQVAEDAHVGITGPYEQGCECAVIRAEINDEPGTNILEDCLADTRARVTVRTLFWMPAIVHSRAFGPIAGLACILYPCLWSRY